MFMFYTLYSMQSTSLFWGINKWSQIFPWLLESSLNAIMDIQNLGEKTIIIYKLQVLYKSNSTSRNGIVT